MPSGPIVDKRDWPDLNVPSKYIIKKNIFRFALSEHDDTTQHNITHVKES